ncbi:pancreatic triacylglycerol lipase-like [Pyxicephalus adspersus]|uniref:pancreatic triacylglycerol lipase-like n=1 Tax=Pyxicephalus adspersus TaxID=30357 RepID=UPI003B5978A7
MLKPILLLMSMVASVAPREVCYQRLGCFSDENPFSGTLQRPISHLPSSPDKINTRFLLYTRDNPNIFQEISAVNSETIKASNFLRSRKTRFIIHGFIDSGENRWLKDLCQAMLQVEDVNCICVDWHGGSLALYTQASNNIRVVGAEVAYFIRTIESIYNYSSSNVHLIGHSLGAHTAAEAGKRHPGIGRITGLDPAQPYFQDTPPEVRLDPLDAALVDVIHTDGTPFLFNLGLGGYGMSQTVGHLDFYPNGGKQMPGCPSTQILKTTNIDNMLDVTDDLVACNHLRSYKYYLDSILSPDGLLGYPASSYDAFQEGAGFPCPKGGCPRMGHYAENYSGITSATQKFYLNTGDQKDFSRKIHTDQICSIKYVKTKIENYETLVTELDARPDDELTLEYVEDKLVDEYEHKTESKNSPSVVVPPRLLESAKLSIHANGCDPSPTRRWYQTINPC